RETEHKVHKGSQTAFSPVRGYPSGRSREIRPSKTEVGGENRGHRGRSRAGRPSETPRKPRSRRLEPVTGIEPAPLAWEARVLPLNYTGTAQQVLLVMKASTPRRYAHRGLLSDRDIRAEIAAGRLALEPFDDSLVQPSSIDVRLDNLFRVFNNTRYTHIDPSIRQDELTSLVQAEDGEPFVLHPGEFVLGSTLELCSLPDDLAGRLEGKSSLGRLGLLTHSTAGFIDPGF